MMIGTNQSNWGYSVATLIMVITGIVVTLIHPQWWHTVFATGGFIPHGHCYLWKPSLVWLHVWSDALIALAYLGISAALAYLVYETRRQIPFHWMFLAFGSFIIACGGTHAMEVWTLWHPMYWLSGWIKVVTAIASVTTAVILPFLIPRALTLVEMAKLSEERRLHLENANQELETLYDKLKELDQLKTRFFANVSHELRTPLTLILGPTEKLLNTDGLTEEQNQSLTVIQRNAHLLLKQVNDLLDVSKLEAGKMELHCTAVDLAQLVRLTCANFDGLAHERDIIFTVETPDTLAAEIDASKVQRILLNLLSNAFKFTPAAGWIRCSLSVEKVPDSVNSPNSAPPCKAVIVVQDSGPGVPFKLREIIFDRFHQGEGGMTRQFGGTGLGLAIVKEFAELLDGTTCVDDAPAGGARFTVKLPLVELPDQAALTTPTVSSVDSLIQPAQELDCATEAARSWSAQEAEKPLVLVVEDNADMNRFIVETLALDYRVATARDGQQGLEQAVALSPDLILSDMMMPQMSGDQFLQQVRSRPEFHATPVVMLTAKADDELRIQLLQQGAQDYLMKPFSVEELQARIGNLLAIKRTRDLLQQELASQSNDLEALAQEVSLHRRELQRALEQLQRQAEELAQANQLKDEFLAIVSHELRTPLNSILGWAQALQTRTFDQATTSRALETIERNARLQSRLVENLLDVSRLLRGKLPLDMYLVDLQSVIRLTVQLVQPDAETKAIRLKTYLDSSVAPVPGNSARLGQVVEQLLSNAIKFTPTGGSVEITLEQQDNQAIIRVSDTGQGIQPEFLPHVFDYFRQADSSLTRAHGGLGLGLTIAQQLVKLHHGQIQVESPGAGHGTTFIVTLPLNSSSA
jgi:signal transduction histidine kinase